jgi:putative acetyltransferase
MENIIIRKIQSTDNAALAKIIRSALEEFKANKPGTVYFDDSTDHLFELFTSTPKSLYLVAEKEGIILGGAGIFPTENLPENFCELVKMYLSKDARGLGLGKKMIALCLNEAKQLGYTKVYLETMPELSNAVKVYEKFGFQYIDHPLGKSGHCGCDLWMLKDL